MTRAEARTILNEIGSGKRYCRTSRHFEEEALAEGFSIEDVWYLLRGPSMTEPEDRSGGTWRVRLTGVTLDDREARLVVDLAHQEPVATLPSLPSGSVRKKPMSADTCSACRGNRVRILRPKLHPYRLSGLDNVFLRGGVTRFECADCGEAYTQVDQEQQLMEMIALGLLLKPAMLTGPEMRFLRKASRLTQDDLARRLGLTRRALIEREKKPRPGLRLDQELGLRALLFAAFRSRLEGEGSHLHPSQSHLLEDAYRRFIDFAEALTRKNKIRRTTLSKDPKENRWRFEKAPLAA